MRYGLLDDLKQIYRKAPILTVTTLLMIPSIFICMYGLFADTTVITGIPAWDKPLKFAVSTGIYTASLALLVRYTQVWPRTIRVCEGLAGIALILEIIIIDAQAARHTTSHFNVATPLDSALWSTMAVGIAVLWVSSIILTAATFRSFYRKPLRTMAVRWGMVITVLGMSTGALMSVPTQQQKEAVAVTHHLGGHTIGGVDGGPGLPLLNWSTQHGDVRPAHFIGIHALQMLFLFALVVECFSITEGKRLRFLAAGIASYGTLFLLVLIEALSAYPFLDHSTSMLVAWAGWLVVTAALFFVAFFAKDSKKVRGLGAA